ncbi:hypothetical protein L873DRAFT_1803048, partial [Choiromyces venosus 120613-1]
MPLVCFTFCSYLSHFFMQVSFPASCIITLAVLCSADILNFVKTDYSLIEQGLLDVIADSPL